MSNEAPASIALKTYLNDHLGGAATGLQVVDHLIETAEDPSDAEFFKALHAEISADRSTLETVLQKAGGTPSGIRQLGGWIAEKLSRLKLVVDDPGHGMLRRLEALELLVLGIHGKRLMWRALGTVSAPGLQGIDFQGLERRATEQHDRVEAKRVETVRRALSQNQ